MLVAPRSNARTRVDGDEFRSQFRELCPALKPTFISGSANNQSINAYIYNVVLLGRLYYKWEPSSDIIESINNNTITMPHMHTTTVAL